MSVVIFGHTGFLGSSIRSYLIQNGFSVLAASSKECDLLEPDQVLRYFARVSVPFQVVFCAGITRWIDDSFESMLRNVRMVHNVVTALRGSQPDRIIYLSSADVYGFSPVLPITESTPPAPANFYGLSKFCGERLLFNSGLFDCPVTVLRLPGVYGPGDSGRSVVGHLLAQMQRYGRVTVHGDGQVVRDYVEVGDVCEIIRRLLTEPFRGVLNVATGVCVTVLELIDILAEAAQLSAAIEYNPASPTVATDLVFDAALLRSVLPGLVFKTLPEGIASYLVSTTGWREGRLEYA